jgi:putative CRISPR-associated protein (TIGR02619 family)
MNHLMMVSTVGTSLWTNGAPEDVRKDLLKHANAEHLSAFDHQTLIEDFLKDQTEKLMSSDPAVAKRMGAELNGILTFREQQAHASEHHVLIASKTFVGERAARAVREWLIQHGIKTVDVRVIDDLVTNNLERFRLAMGQIVNCCAQELGLPNQHQHTVFNLTGGFKSVQGFMQTVGMLWADECISIFENGELLRIPRLPVALQTAGVVRDHLLDFRLMHQGQDVPAVRLQQVPETLLEQIGDQAALSTWGSLVFETERKTIYQELLEPLNDRVEFTERFRKEASGLTPDERRQANERLEELALQVTGLKPYSSGLDFKQLKSQKVNGNDHQFRLFGDDVRRAYGRYQGSVFVVDCITDGLH